MTAIASHHPSRRVLVPFLASSLIATVGCTSATSPAPSSTPSPTSIAAAASPSALVEPSAVPSEATASPSLAPLPSLAPTPAPSPTLPATIGAAPSGPWTTVGWVDAGSAFPMKAPAGSDTFLLDVYGWSDGYVAFGGNAGSSSKPSPATLEFTSSADGVHWSAPKPISLKGLSDEIEIVSVAESPGGLVAVGEYPPGTCGGPSTYAGLWHSSDGTAWTRIQEPAAMASAGISSLNGGPSGFIATGTRSNGTPVVWLSSDGSTWNPGTLPQVTKGKLVIDNGFSVPGGLVLSGAIVGPPGCGGNSEVRPAVWWSADGASWTQETLPKSKSDLALTVRRLADGGLVAIEDGGGSDATFDWITADGKTWQQVKSMANDVPFNLIIDGSRAIVAEENPDNNGPWTIAAVADDLQATALTQSGAVPTETDDSVPYIFTVGPTGVVAVATNGSSLRLGIPGS